MLLATSAAMLDTLYGSAVDLARMRSNEPPGSPLAARWLTLRSPFCIYRSSRRRYRSRWYELTCAVSLADSTTSNNSLTNAFVRTNRRGCLREGNLRIMGHLHPHHADDSGPLYQLLPAAEEGHRYPRDRRIHFCWCATPPLIPSLRSMTTTWRSQ